MQQKSKCNKIINTYSGFFISVSSEVTNYGMIDFLVNKLETDHDLIGCGVHCTIKRLETNHGIIAGGSQ